MLLAKVLRRLVTYGDLVVIDADGESHRFGGRPITDVSPADLPAPVRLRLKDRRLHWRLVVNPGLAFGEGYMDGGIEIEQGSLRDVLGLFMYNMHRGNGHWTIRLQERLNGWLRWLHQHNPVDVARKNVAHHYDLSGELYDLFLDRDRQYSCAYFPTGMESLDVAQEAKKRHIAAKLLLQPGLRVLDIGCGWGGMALYLAREFGAHVTGVTLSREQLAVARRRAAEEKLEHRVTFQLLDYRLVDDQFDRIVSVGMFEHVGARHYREFFGKVRDLLKPDGIALLHTIGRPEPPGGTNAWIRKYIFPGGYSPALSELMAAVEHERLIPCDVEMLRLHYAKTLRHWHDRFQANRDEAKALYDERFCRMWEFYLVASEMAFRHESHMIFQVQLARHQEAVPLVRDYVTAFEATQPLRLAAAEDRAAAPARRTAARPKTAAGRGNGSRKPQPATAEAPARSREPVAH
ncbi:cyclopropane-fatty-acyl-phospholipid synthase [Caenispirillum bisanense]|uniref:Cyclopropane-fatty-acyl-phospholipid synthase n=1 Tax=Caenispirillum bisanense TaxID=414052 RepID=A0A286G209_9PROT|nr:cyclopropane-fatty-acyl-phospholipid synthase family protein [Caenispirillum bisanense]SOD89024.1 cyclopropane-fatty-acyl-phospholipid synthase [Caenispirillum bisanense]